MVVLPFAVPFSWLIGVLVMAALRPPGWQATLAMSVGGLSLPVWLYASTIDQGFPAWVGYPLAGISLLGCFVATHRILSRSARQ